MYLDFVPLVVFKKEEKEGVYSKYLLTAFQQRFREGLPGLAPGTLPGAPAASLRLLVAP